MADYEPLKYNPHNDDDLCTNHIRCTNCGINLTELMDASNTLYCDCPFYQTWIADEMEEDDNEE